MNPTKNKHVNNKTGLLFKDNSLAAFARQLNSYSYQYTYKESKQWALEWLLENDPVEATRLNSVDEYSFSNRGFICKMIKNGFEVTDSMKEDLRAFFKNIKVEAKEPAKEKEEPIEPTGKKFIEIGNTEIMKLDQVLERAMAGEEFTNAKFGFDPTPNKKSDIKDLIKLCQDVLLEMKTTPEFYKPETLKLIRPIYTSAMAEAMTLATYQEKTKSKTKLNSMKKLNPIQMTKNVKYLLESTDLGIKGIVPPLVVGNKECILYDTEKRKLIKLVSTETDGILFSGATIKNFDSTKSFSKVIRKPEEIFRIFKMQPELTYNDINNIYQSVNARPIAVNVFRPTENTIFVRAKK